MLQRTNVFVLQGSGQAQLSDAAVIQTAKFLKDCAFSAIPWPLLQCFQTDFRESALRNYNAALQNSSVQGLFGRRPCEARGMKLRGNRNQTFGTVSSNFHRNCPNREHKPARFFEGNFRRCRLISALALLYTRLTSGAKRLCS
jgi:hypothetical protein